MRNPVLFDRRAPRGTPPWSPLLLLSGSVAAAVLLIGAGLSMVGEVSEGSLAPAITPVGSDTSSRPVSRGAETVQVAGTPAMR